MFVDDSCLLFTWVMVFLLFVLFLLGLFVFSLFVCYDVFLLYVDFLSVSVCLVLGYSTSCISPRYDVLLWSVCLRWLCCLSFLGPFFLILSVFFANTSLLFCFVLSCLINDAETTEFYSISLNASLTTVNWKSILVS